MIPVPVSEFGLHYYNACQFVSRESWILPWSPFVTDSVHSFHGHNFLHSQGVEGICLDVRRIRSLLFEIVYLF